MRKQAVRRPRRPIEEVIHEYIVQGRITLVYYRGTKDTWDIVHILSKKDICKSEITLAMPYKYGKRILVKSKVMALDEIIELYTKGRVTLLNGIPIALPSDVIDQNEYFRIIVIGIELDYEEREHVNQITTITFILQTSINQYNVCLCLGDDDKYTLLITNIQTKEDLINITLKKDFRPLETVEHQTMESLAVYNKTMETLKQVAKEFYNNCKEM